MYCCFSLSFILMDLRLSLLSLVFQIHIIDFDDENNIINKNVLSHQSGEIWHIAACPADKTVFTTCYNKSESLIPVSLKVQSLPFPSKKTYQLTLGKKRVFT